MLYRYTRLDLRTLTLVQGVNIESFTTTFFDLHRINRINLYNIPKDTI